MSDRVADFGPTSTELDGVLAILLMDQSLITVVHQTSIDRISYQSDRVYPIIITSRRFIFLTGIQL
ncbi:hypothetical protein D3C81_2183850 [compost metagenome]